MHKYSQAYFVVAYKMGWIIYTEMRGRVYFDIYASVYLALTRKLFYIKAGDSVGFWKRRKIGRLINLSKISLINHKENLKEINDCLINSCIGYTWFS
jgi:hypothetical protein